MAKNPKPLASYYATRHRMTVGGVPCGFARPPVGPQDREARIASGRSLAASRAGLNNSHFEKMMGAVKAWQARPIEERLALQDAALARVAPVAPTAETEAPAMPENLPAESHLEPAPAVTLPPEPVSALDGAESATVAASEPEPAADPEPVAAVAPDAPVSLADMLRQAADRIEALEADIELLRADARESWRRGNEIAADANRRSDKHKRGRAWALRTARDWKRIATDNAEQVDKLRTQLAIGQSQYDALKAELAESVAAVVKAADDDMQRTREAFHAKAAALEAPKPDPVAAARAQMRKMGIPVGVTFHSPNPAQHVRVMVAA